MSDLRIRGFDRDVIGAAVHQPSLESLRHTLARRRWYRRGGALAALVLLGVPAALFGALPAGDDDRRPAGPTPLDVVVLGPRTAVGVWRINECEVGFRRTEDGGRSWTPYRTTRDIVPCPGPAGSQPVLYEVLIIDPTAYLIRVASPTGRRFLSVDGGSTWQDASAASVEVDAFPEGARPVGCRMCGANREPLAFDPAARRLYRLRSGPWTEAMMTDLVAARDGTMWISASDPEFPTYRLYRSADRGRTWTMPAIPPVQTMFGFGVRDGQEAYVLGGSVGGRQVLHHTVDGGSTWTDVVTDLPYDTTLLPFSVLPDATIIAVRFTGTETRAWVSRDGGRRFAPGLTVAGRQAADDSAERVWIWDDAAHRVMVTADGRTWKPLPLP